MAPLLVRLWVCIGLAMLMLTGVAGVASAAPPAEAATVGAQAQGLEPSTKRCAPARHEHTRVAGPELGALELDLDDGDLRADMGALAAATTPGLEPSALGSIAARAAADTGRPQIVTTLARGPPVA